MKMNHSKEDKKKGRPKKEIVKFGSLKINEYCCLADGTNLYMKIKKGSKKKNCIIMQTGQVESLPLDQVVHRVKKETIRPAVPQIVMETSKQQPTTPQEKSMMLEPDVVIDLDD